MNEKQSISLHTLCVSFPTAFGQLTSATSATALGLAAALASGVSIPAFAQSPATSLPAVRVDAPPEKRHAAAAAKPKPAVAAQARPAPAAPGRHTAVGTRRGAPNPTVAGQGGAAGAGGTPSLVALPAIGWQAPYQVRTVESNKFTLPILNTPQSITVVPQAVMQETGSRSLSEVLRNTPGVTFDAGENGFGGTNNNIRLRGFNATSDIYIDNSRDNGNYTRDMFNTERVEVFKGAAADNGRGSAGGYINLVTKVPMLANFVSGDAWYGWDHYNSESRKRGTADANYVVGENTAIRLNAMYENSGVPGRQIALARPWGIAPSISFGLGTPFRITFLYEHQERRDLPDWGIPAAAVSNMVRSDPIAMTSRRDTFFGLRRDYDNVDADSAEARVAYDITPDIVVSNQTRWSHVHRMANYTLPTGYAPTTGMVTTQNQAYDRDNSTLTNLANLTAKFNTWGFRHELSTGIDYTNERSFAYRYGAGANLSQFIFGPDFYRFQAIAAPNSTANLKIETVAGYVYDSIHLHPQWILTGGVRIEDYNLTIRGRDLNGLPLLPLQTNINDYRNAATTVGGKVGLVYKPIKLASLYGAVSWSNQPVGANFLSNPDISRAGDDALPNLVDGSQPIRMVNYEIGGKWEAFDGRLLTSLALFRTEKTLPITGCFGNPPGLPGAGCIGGANQPITLKGYGTQFAQGIEFGVAGNVTEDWRMFGGFLILDTRRVHNFWLDWFRMAAQGGDYPVFAPGIDAPWAFLNGFYRRGTSGDQLSFSPNVTGNLWSTYHIPTTPVTLGGGLLYVGNSWVGRPDDAARIIPNGRFGQLPSYFVVNLMSSFEVYKDVFLNLNVDNVANKKFAANTNWPAQRALLGTPRAYRFSMNFRF